MYTYATFIEGLCDRECIGHAYGDFVGAALNLLRSFFLYTVQPQKNGVYRSGSIQMVRLLKAV